MNEDTGYSELHQNGPYWACSWRSAELILWGLSPSAPFEFNIDSQHHLFSLRSILHGSVSARVFLKHFKGYLKDDLSKAQARFHD